MGRLIKISFVSFVIGMIVALTVSSCSDADLDNAKDVFNINLRLREKVRIDPEIATYYRYFYEIYKEYPKDISAVFGNTHLSEGPTTSIGICIRYRNNRYKIILDRDWWDVQKDTEICSHTDTDNPRICSRQALVFHELGHCLFHRDHRKDIEYSNHLKRYVPVSLMYPLVLKSEDYHYRQDIYNEELVSIKGGWE